MEVCSTCGLPLDLCVCGELERESTKITVRMEMRKLSKPATIIEGMDPKRNDLYKIASQLKTKLACGGTVKNGSIILQGDHRFRIKQLLTELGFKEDSIEVQ